MAQGTTHVCGGIADTIESAARTLRVLLGAHDVRLEQADAPAGTTVYSAVVPARGSEPWRLHVLRDEPLSDAERESVDALAGLMAQAVARGEDAVLADNLADMVDATLLELDAMIGATVEERLVKVARGLAEALDVTGWSVRILVDGEWVLVANEHRRGRLQDPLTGWAPFDPRHLELDEGSMVVRPGDSSPVADSLRHCELSSLVGATGYDPDAVSWTVCMVGDDVSGDLAPGRTALAALVPAALGFPLPPRTGGLLRSIG